MVGVREEKPGLYGRTEMRGWLESKKIATLSDTGKWPTADTAALWKRFRDETLSGGFQGIRVNETRRNLAGGQPRPKDGLYRLEVDHPSGEAWICTADYRRLAKLRSRVSEPANGLFPARFISG